LTKNVLHCLKMKERTRSNRLNKIKTKEKKKERVKRKRDDLVRDEAVARKERAKREGVYKSGINMQEHDIDGNEEGQQKLAARKINRNAVTCPHCGKKGHATVRSKKCLHYAGGQQQGVAQAQQAPADGENNIDPADDIDAMDSMPLVADPHQLDTEEDIEALHTFLAHALVEDEHEEVTLVRGTL
jgi:hypothetical protein